mgnify:CR=1 FL=1
MNGPSERIRNRRKSSLNKTENDRFTRFDEKTDSLLDINRSNCRDHADFKKSFMSTNVLKVSLELYKHAFIKHSLE